MNKIFLGDCLEVLPGLEKSSINLVLSDLPYGITQKPLALMEYLVKTFSNEGDLILDPCCGSGTSLLAAKNLNRNYVGIELDPSYFEVSLERLCPSP